MVIAPSLCLSSILNAVWLPLLPCLSVPALSQHVGQVKTATLYLLYSVINCQQFCWTSRRESQWAWNERMKSVALCKKLCSLRNVESSVYKCYRWHAHSDVRQIVTLNESISRKRKEKNECVFTMLGFHRSWEQTCV